MVQHHFKTGAPFWNSKTVQHRFKMGQIPKWGTTNIRFPGKEIRASAYRVLLEAYRTALTSIWSQAQFANTEQILKTISDRQMTELTTMSKLLKPEPTTSKVSKEP